MNTINRPKSFVKFPVIIGTLFFVFLLVFFPTLLILSPARLSYIAPAIVSILAFGIAFIASIRQKRISVIFLLAFIVGMVFLASGILQFGYKSFTENIPIHDKAEFSRIVRPDQVSRGLNNVGSGFIYAVWAVISLKRKTGSEERFHAQRYKIVGTLIICSSIFLMFFGLYNVIDGFRPLS